MIIGNWKPVRKNKKYTRTCGCGNTWQTDDPTEKCHACNNRRGRVYSMQEGKRIKKEQK